MGQDADETVISGPRGFWGAAPTRLFAMFIVLVLAYAGTQIAILVISTKMPGAAVRLWLPMVAAPLLAGALLAIYVSLVRMMERRTPAELAPKPGGLLVLAGLALGVLLFCSVYAVLWAYGAAHFIGFNGPAGMALPLAMAILAGVGEELIFRGVVFRVVEESCGTLVALVVSAGVFGLVHLSAPGATAASTLAIALEAGLLLAAAYLVTRNLWFPIGLHIGWNFTEGGVFGSAVSGHGSSGLLNTTLTGPVSLTGGSFGPEASPAAVSVCLVVAIVLLAWVLARGEWRPFGLRLYPR